MSDLYGCHSGSIAAVLYSRDGYYKLGDSKYYLYRNISLICIGICLVVQIIVVVKSYLMEKHRRIEQRCRMENCASVGMYIGMYIRKTGKK